MTTLMTRIDPAGEAARRNAAEHAGLIGELREKLAAAALGGPASSRDTHVPRDELPRRVRADRVHAAGSPSLQAAPIAAAAASGGQATGSRITTDGGHVHGGQVVRFSEVTTVMAGAAYLETASS